MQSLGEKNERGIWDEKQSEHKGWGEEMQMAGWMENEEAALAMPVCAAVMECFEIDNV